jgi:5-methylcytosine-specific restriction endonuclease McrA
MEEDLPKSRKEAMAAKARYYMGSPCKHSHHGKRYVRTGACVECRVVRTRSRQTADSQRRQESFRRRQEAIASGSPHYMGSPCKRGHDGKRYINNHTCVECVAEINRSKADARRTESLGSVYYISDPCKHGHAGKRFVSNDKCVECQNERSRRWRVTKSGRASTVVIAANRRARKRGADGSYTRHDVAKIAAAQKGRCAVCKKRAKLTIDHIVPLSKGGSNWPSNLQMTCMSCNCRKNDKDPIAFMREQGRLL